MFCPHCGTTVDGLSNCPNCGAPVQNAVPVQVNSAPNQMQGNPVQVLVFGILGLALGAATGFVGLVFSIIAIVKGNNYIATYGNISNQVRIGRRLGIAGIFVSILMIVCIIIIIAGAAAGVTEISKEITKV